MGFLTAPPRTEFNIVAQGVGRIMGPSGAYDKSKFWLKEDGTLVLAVMDRDTRQVERQHHQVTAANFDAGGRASFDTPQGRWNFAKAPCSCGYGALGYAAIADGRISLNRVRPPEWVTGL
jgi:hypothetical protein